MFLEIRSERLVQRLLSQPESGMGYQIVTVVLVDGREFRRVVAVDGRLSDSTGAWAPPFEEGAIADLVVTHDSSGPPFEVRVSGT
jgi:hypothetical protein